MKKKSEKKECSGLKVRTQVCAGDCFEVCKNAPADRKQLCMQKCNYG